MKKLLLTGFVPFLDFPINPTEKIVQALDGQKIGSYKVIGLLLPVDYSTAPEKLISEIRRQSPDAVISLGLAAGRTGITPERVAINCRDGEADNSGEALRDVPILEGAADGYFSTLPIRKMVDSLNSAGFPADISNTAGTYLCNNVMYAALHETGQKIPAGFIHIPASHELAIKSGKSFASWSDRDLLDAVKLVIEIIE